MRCNNSSYQYHIGGSVPLYSPTYVTRKADDDFYNGLKSGEFCYVLNSRQMGKSSLRVRTMQRLQENGTACAVIDITQIGNTETDINNLDDNDKKKIEWYAGIIEIIASQLNIPDFDLNSWWEKHANLSPVHHFAKFAEEILLKKISQHIVIFVDESDAIGKFGDEFFALIRSFYEYRATNSDYNRLTFGILGVASPGDLIKDKKKTPFNIGKPIDLTGFNLHEAMPLAEGLKNKAENPEAVLKAIIDWTGGQPFLTQKVCSLICRDYSDNRIISGTEADSVAQVIKNGIVEYWESKDEPQHLKYIRDRIMHEGGQKTSRLLGLYLQVLNSSVIADDNPDQTELRLSGLAVKRNGLLQVYNRVYAEVFNQAWAEATLKNLRPYSEDFNAWKASDYKDDSRLMTGQKLQEAVAWAEGKSLSDEEHRYIGASRRLEQKATEEALKAEMQSKEIKARKKENRMLLAFLVIALIIGGLLSGNGSRPVFIKILQKNRKNLH